MTVRNKLWNKRKGECEMQSDEASKDARDEMIEKAMEQMKIKRRNLSREELEEEIIDYLSKKQPCSLATCGKDGAPRISVVDYINEGPTICLNLNMV
jgi:hypothetical protein